MSESENKTTKDLLDKSIESIKAKKVESKLKELDLIEEEIENKTHELYDHDYSEVKDDDHSEYDSDDMDIEEDKIKAKYDKNNESENHIDEPDLKEERTPTKKLTSLAVLLSIFIPGFGSIYAKNYKRGLIFFGLSCLFFVLFLVIEAFFVEYMFLPLIAMCITYIWGVVDARHQADEFNKRNKFSTSTIQDSLEQYPFLEKIFIIFFRAIYWIYKITAFIIITSTKIVGTLIGMAAKIVGALIGMVLTIVAFILGLFWRSFKSQFRCPQCHSDWSLNIVRRYDCGSYERCYYECKNCGYQVIRDHRK